MNTYWTYDISTLEVLGSIECSKWNAPRNTFLTPPLSQKSGVAVMVVLDEQQQVTGTQYQPDYRGQTIYNTADCTVSKTVTQLGEIEKGWTVAAPVTGFDEWIEGGWITDEDLCFIDQYNQVDDKRRRQYKSGVDPLMAEAAIKAAQGKPEEASALQQQALALREKIQSEHPYPAR